MYIEQKPAENLLPPFHFPEDGLGDPSLMFTCQDRDEPFVIIGAYEEQNDKDIAIYTSLNAKACREMATWLLKAAAILQQVRGDAYLERNKANNSGE